MDTDNAVINRFQGWQKLVLLFPVIANTVTLFEGNRCCFERVYT